MQKPRRASHDVTPGHKNIYLVMANLSKKSVNLSDLYETITAMSARSAWDRGVIETAIDILDTVKGDFLNVEISELEKVCLNGASDWSQYSWGGCLLIYNEGIAERFCSPSELKKVTGVRGLRNPNKQEQWLDVQARGASQAFNLILKTAKRLTR
jgi:hypothetical protein